VKLLEDLGYDLFDFDLWKGYLILEEASAERIIRDFLIPKFCPGLQECLRTISAAGQTRVEPHFEDFLRLFRFIHTSEPYKNKAWVFIDGDSRGRRIVENLKQKFSHWNADRFRVFEREDFELYYPPRFQEEASTLLAMEKGEPRRVRKAELVKKVINWVENEPDAAKKEFADSAAEVIGMLKEIESALNT
jgi:hypothetical protein